MNIDAPCFVFGIALDGSGGCSDLENNPASPTWLHIDYSHDSAEAWLQDLELDQSIIDALIRQDTRPRTVAHKSGKLLVIRGVNTNPGADPEDMVSLRMWIEADRIITVRQRKLLSVQEVKEALDVGAGPTSVEDLVVLIIERIADKVAEFVEQIEAQVDELETGIHENRSAPTRDMISSVRRTIATVRRYMAPQREALESLYRIMLQDPKDNRANAVREQTDRIIRYVEDLDLNREKALVIQEELMNLIMEQQNSRMYALSIVAVVFLPITFISGVFGMNVAGLPGVSDPNSFSYVVYAMAAVSITVVIYLLAKRWL